MTNTNETVRLSAVDTAKMLRKQLRSAFPGVKFAVRGEQGSARGYYDVAWTGGPSRDLVREVCAPYEGTRFGQDEYGNQDIEYRVPTLLGMDADGRGLESGIRGINLLREVTSIELGLAKALLAQAGYSGLMADDFSTAAHSVALGYDVHRAAKFWGLQRG